MSLNVFILKIIIHKNKLVQTDFKYLNKFFSLDKYVKTIKLFNLTYLPTRRHFRVDLNQGFILKQDNTQIISKSS